ncbi:MAG: hypothetical protein HYY93_12185 [Planctomycetes bacterium]|nr:hypothetical protein [Planctomycetota bacterium]
MRGKSLGRGALLAGVLLGMLPAVVDAKDDPVKVLLVFKLPAGKEAAVKAEVDKIEGVRDVTLSKGALVFAVEEEAKVTLTQVLKVVEEAAGKDAKFDRVATRLVGSCEIEFAGLDADQTADVKKAIGKVAGVEKVETPGSGRFMVTTRSPKGVALAEIEKAATMAVKVAVSGDTVKETRLVQEITWVGPDKGGQKDKGCPSCGGGSCGGGGCGHGK